MKDQNNLKDKRIQAYAFIKSLFRGVSWVYNDNILAHVLAVELNDLILLKEGKINPSPELVKQVYDFFKSDLDLDLGRPQQIKRFLVEPF